MTPPARGPRLRTARIPLADAKAFIALHHRHHPPPVGHIVSVGAWVEGTSSLVGVAVIGRPVARHYDDGDTLEVTRTCTDGTRNANSALYGRCEKIRAAFGCPRMCTTTQQGESGSSLKGAGWRLVYVRPARGGWDTPSRRRSDVHPVRVDRMLWISQGSSVWPQRDGLDDFRYELTPTCIHCGHQMKVAAGRTGPVPLYCSRACRQRAYRRRRDTPKPDAPAPFVATGGLWEAS